MTENLIGKYKNQILITIDDEDVKEYLIYYFKKYPNRRVAPIDRPTHPSMNKWMIMKRPQMNDTKQKWKEFTVWIVKKNGLENKMIEECEMTFISYFKTKIRKDVDNTSPKFVLDGFPEARLIIDDDSLHLTSLTLKCGYDKLRPRTEIYINY